MLGLKVKRKGEFFALFAYLFWGLLPVFWKHLAEVPPAEIVAHRLLWCGIGMVLLSILLRRSARFSELFVSNASIPYAWDIRSNWRSLALLFLSTLAIASNFLLYVSAVNSSDILEVSLSNFIAPLVHIILGKLILKERLNRLQILAILLAACGVFFLGLEYDHVPWTAIGLALGFGVYGFLRKISRLNAIQGLTLETLLMAPLCLVYLFYLAYQGQGHFSLMRPDLMGLLILSGPITLIPLLSFTQGAKLLELSRLGFFQLTLPTIQFLLAVFVYHETITAAFGIGFALISFALVLYVASAYLNALLPRRSY